MAKPGDKITLVEKTKQKQRIQDALATAGRREQPEWVEFDSESLTGTVKTMPAREAVTLPIQEQLIVEFYSR